MPRRPRLKLAGIPQHIVQRGINRGACFFADEDYHCYLHWLMKSAVDWCCKNQRAQGRVFLSDRIDAVASGERGLPRKDCAKRTATEIALLKE